MVSSMSWDVRGDTLYLIFPRLTSRLLPEAEGHSRTQPRPHPPTAMTWFHPRQRAARSPSVGERGSFRGQVSESHLGAAGRSKEKTTDMRGVPPSHQTSLMKRQCQCIISHYKLQDVEHRALNSKAQHPPKHGALSDCPGHTPTALPRPRGKAGGGLVYSCKEIHTHLSLQMCTSV